jgi:DNA-binding LacI/PurR family transcriptional regulator
MAWSPCELDPGDPRKVVETLLHRLPQLSGLVVHNEAALTGVLLELERRNLEVPRDVSVVAVLPDDAARSYGERITSVRIPVSSISRLAVRMVTAQLRGHTAPEVRLLSPHPLVERAAVTPLMECPRQGVPPDH